MVTTMVLHYYIRRHSSHHDLEFDISDEEQSYVPSEVYEYCIGQSMIETDPDVSYYKARYGEGVEEMRDLKEKTIDVLVNE